MLRVMQAGNILLVCRTVVFGLEAPSYTALQIFPFNDSRAQSRLCNSENSGSSCPPAHPRHPRRSLANITRCRYLEYAFLSCFHPVHTSSSVKVAASTKCYSDGTSPNRSICFVTLDLVSVGPCCIVDSFARFRETWSHITPGMPMFQPRPPQLTSCVHSHTDSPGTCPSRRRPRCREQVLCELLELFVALQRLLGWPQLLSRSLVMARRDVVT